jgi:hypothetical protein
MGDMSPRLTKAVPKPSQRPIGPQMGSQRASRAIQRAIEKAERTKERHRKKAEEKRDLQRQILAALKARNLPTGKAVKPKREGPPRKGTVIDEPYRTWVRAQGCVLRGRWCHDDNQIPAFQDSYHVCWGPVEFHHVKTRGAGGKDRGNGVGLCTTGHRSFHDLGRATFDARYAIDLAHVARDLDAAYHHTQGEA